MLSTTYFIICRGGLGGVLCRSLHLSELAMISVMRIMQTLQIVAIMKTMMSILVQTE